MATEEKVYCETPTPGKQGTNIAKWKYDLIKEAILAIVPSTGGGFPFKDLPDAVRERLGPQQIAKIGSAAWYTTTVKLDLETKGLLERVPGTKLQMLRRKDKT